MKKPTISAILFSFWPEEVNLIEAALKSVSFADEIIVIDNGAGDEVINKVKKYTDKVFYTPSRSFAERHNLGHEKSKGDWLLFVDADERVSHSLKESIVKVVANSEFNAYEILRVNFFLGKMVKYGDRNPDFVARLFKSSSLVKWVGDIHESSVVKGKTGQIKEPLYHLTHWDIFSMLRKTINYSENEAQIRLAANHPKVVGWRLVRVFLTEFWQRMVSYQGWRQGTEGWIDGIFQAFSLFIVYARLWELQREESLEDSYKKIDDKISSGDL